MPKDRKLCPVGWQLFRKGDKDVADRNKKYEKSCLFELKG